VLIKKIIGHGRVATPAEEADVGFELYVWGPVHLRIRFDGMAHKADRLIVDLPDRAVALQHDMRIDRSVAVQGMAFGADRPPVSSIGTSPQEFRTSLVARPAMDFMAGETSHYPVV
jgi:hypothetical protein